MNPTSAQLAILRALHVPMTGRQLARAIHGNDHKLTRQYTYIELRDMADADLITAEGFPAIWTLTDTGRALLEAVAA